MRSTAGVGSTPEEAVPIWDWSLDRILAVTQNVCAGKDLTPDRWPGGARVAVALSFDFDAQTGWIRRGKHSPASMSRGEYGARVGVPRILGLLDRLGLPATFFVPAVTGQLHPEAIDQILRRDRHEIGMHGWIHELAQELTGDQERELAGRAFEYWASRIGRSPAGVRTPSWDFTTHTLPIIRELGLTYDSSLMSDDRPYELNEAGYPTGIVELPVEWLLDDHPYFQMDPAQGVRSFIHPDAVLTIWRDEFDTAFKEGTLFLLTMHPQVIGHRARLRMLERLLEGILGKDRVWFATHADVANYVRGEAGLVPPAGR